MLMQSSDDPKETSPCRLTRPYVGLSPTTPQKLAGWRTEPPVSEPRATGVTPAATSAADPPEEPPGTRSGNSGCCTRPKAEYSVEEPIANSSMFALQATNAPASRSRFTAVASKGEMYPSRIREAQVVGRSRVAMLSFTPTGTPSSGAFGARLAWELS